MAGIAGAFFAVPVIATVNSMVRAAKHHGSEMAVAVPRSTGRSEGDAADDAPVSGTRDGQNIAQPPHEED